jgi:hypothetical protein
MMKPRLSCPDIHTETAGSSTSAPALDTAGGRLYIKYFEYAVILHFKRPPWQAEWLVLQYGHQIKIP